MKTNTIKATFLCSLLFACLFINSPITHAQQWLEETKLVSVDRGQGDGFGSVMAVSGDYAIMGAQAEDHDLNGFATMPNAGAAYIFKKNTAGDWVQAQKLIASDRDQDDRFGCSVAISGNYAVVGAYFEDVPGQTMWSHAGAAYIFEKNNQGNWVEVQKIVAPTREFEDYFGIEVAISVDYLIVGANREDHDVNEANFLDYAGSAYIYERNSSGQWQFAQKLVASDRGAFDYFGSAVALVGNTAIVGSPLEDQNANGSGSQNSAGSAYVFVRDSLGNWNQVQKIIASDWNAGDQFGSQIALDNNFMVISSPFDDEDASGNNSTIESGSAYIFKRLGNGSWIEDQKIVASDRYANDFYGSSVAISGTRVMVGAAMEDDDASGLNRKYSAGSAYVYELNLTSQWQEGQKLVASDRAIEDRLGSAVALVGDDLFVSAPNESEDAQGLNSLLYAGSVYHFVKNQSVGLKAIEKQSQVNLYPNPGNGQVSLEFAQNYNELELDVYNVKGQLVQSYDFSQVQKLELNFALNSGIYILEFKGDNQNFRENLIIE